MQVCCRDINSAGLERPTTRTFIPRKALTAEAFLCPDPGFVLAVFGHVFCGRFVPLVISYRGTTGDDLKREKDKESEITEALAQSKRAMKFGDTYGAVCALESVKQVIDPIKCHYS